MIADRKAKAQHSGTRYLPVQRLFLLALRLAGTRVGLSLEEMATELHVNRRTAERLRDTLRDLFPGMAYTDDDDRVRRWHLPAADIAGVVPPRVEVVATVEAAARDAGRAGEQDRAELLQEAAATLRSILRPEVQRRAEPDIEALMQAEGIAMRPGPRPIIVKGVLPTLRRAILGMQLVLIHYARPDDAEPTMRVLCPYGILHGGRGWLVAHVENTPELRLWRLDRILSADLLDRGFARRPEFDLSAYAAQSFGVFQEEPMDVELRFTAEAAIDAASWQFHPTQILTPEADGALIVRFRAGGVREIVWHLFTWGDALTIIGPERLRTTMAEWLALAARQVPPATAA